MGRTAESYLRDSETKQIQSYFDFAQWPDDQLMDALGHEYTLKDSNFYSEDRLSQIERRIAHLIFEVEYRLGSYGGDHERA